MKHVNQLSVPGCRPKTAKTITAEDRAREENVEIAGTVCPITASTLTMCCLRSAVLLASNPTRASPLQETRLKGTICSRSANVRTLRHCHHCPGSIISEAMSPKRRLTTASEFAAAAVATKLNLTALFLCAQTLAGDNGD